MPELHLRDEVYAIAGAAMEVYYQVGTGFLEPIYQEALEIELRNRRIPFESQKMLSLTYKDILLTKHYVADLLCYGKILIERKAVRQLSAIEFAQLINYLRITKMRVSLLFNFGSSPRVGVERFVI